MRFYSEEKQHNPPIEGVRTVKLMCVSPETYYSEPAQGGSGTHAIGHERPVITKGVPFVFCTVTTMALPPGDDDVVRYSATAKLANAAASLYTPSNMKLAGRKLGEMAQYHYETHEQAVAWAEVAFVQLVRGVEAEG